MAVVDPKGVHPPGGRGEEASVGREFSRNDSVSVCGSPVDSDQTQAVLSSEPAILVASREKHEIFMSSVGNSTRTFN